MNVMPMAFWRRGENASVAANQKRRGHAVLFLLLLWTLPALVWGGVSLEDIDFSALPGDRVQITLAMSGDVPEPSSFITESPARISLDFAGVSSGLAYKSKQIGIGVAHSVNVLEAGNRLRVVINLLNSVAHRVEAQGGNIVITLDAGGRDTAESAEPVAVAGNAGHMVQTPASTAAEAGEGIIGVDFRRGETGEGRVLVTLADSTIPVDVREEGSRVVMEFLGTTVPGKLIQSLDVMDFATPVTLVETRPQGNNVVIEITVTGEYDYMAYQTGNVFAVELRGLSKAEKEAQQKERMVFSGERLSLNFQDIEVRSVLQLLADFTELNLVTSDTVSGRITLRLKNVPWDQALDIILKSKGLSMRSNENVIMIAPTEEIAAREQLELESQQKIEELALLRSEFVQVNYAKAKDLATLLKSSENRLLSERGNVTVDKRTNTLLLQDTAAKLEDIRRLLQRLDIPVRQVLIESRIVIANNDFAKDLGVRFGATFNATSGDSGGLFAGGMPGHLTPGAGVTGIENPAGSGNESLIVNLPATAPSGALNLLVGKVGSYLLQLEISAMQKEGKGEVISSPRVITSDQNKASIKQGVEIPYQEATSSGATSVSFKEAVLKLDVTPHITPDDRIRMDLAINKDSPDFSRSVLGVPPLDTRKIETTVLVDNGETVVLGGVFERTKTKNREQVPLFGDLPYVGALFRKNEQRDENKELLIFVTPKILKDSLRVR
ncbi:MAG: type IV pilus secretin PilQ [endosymbiont of Escarpia spicata]|uniref:Type IV pilus secretin PilQ n=1 Tax=endosymbiont of Escarpia spicata TaxID=2200908 RepID=A0A370DEW8_9GAMM|nr:MAG: type IV pilus secretin PilQ [endosymbiont of Escarpia spicata]